MIENASEISTEIDNFWGPLWSKRPDGPSPEDLDAYLKHYANRIAPEQAPAPVTVELIEAVIMESGASCPGPDGLPFSVYKRLLNIASPILFDIYQELSTGAKPPAKFNHGRLFLIPKGDSMEVHDFRPISVNNS